MQETSKRTTASSSHQPGHSAGLLSTTKNETTNMTYEKIASMQSATNIRFEVAKKIATLLAEAEARFDQMEHELDWQEELGEIQRMVFEE